MLREHEVRLVGSLTAILAVACSLAGVTSYDGISVFLGCISGILLLILSRRIAGEYTSLLFLFSMFFLLYGLSGPINAIFGNQLHDLFPQPYALGPYLVAYGMAISGTAVGLTAGTALLGNWKNSSLGSDFSNVKRSLSFLAVFVALGAGMFEIVNWYRVSGWDLIVSGKATYQSALADMPGTLPSLQAAMLAVIFLALSTGTRWVGKEWAKLVVVGAFLSPLIAVAIMLGGRGVILKLLVTYWLARSFVKPVRRVSLSFAVLVVSVYLVMSAAFEIRGSLGRSIDTGDYSSVVSRISKGSFWLGAINPGRNEFGAAFGNFSTYVKEGGWDKRGGATYFEVFVLPVPRMIWPEKPRSVAYEFRDEFFPSESERGSIAGTGFSSILEGYINFGYIGPFLFYLAVAFVLVCLESKKKKRKSVEVAIIYGSLASATMMIHRSAFSATLTWPIINVLLGVVLYKGVRFLFVRQGRRADYDV